MKRGKPLFESLKKGLLMFITYFLFNIENHGRLFKSQTPAANNQSRQ
jgi:hypothetical protein